MIDLDRLEAHLRRVYAAGASSERQIVSIADVLALITELREARGYAERLARSLQEKHYPDGPKWEPLPDLLGLLTQIDNMTSALTRIDAALEHATTPPPAGSDDRMGD